MGTPITIFTMTELCHHTGVSKEELQEIVELGVIEPVEITNTGVVFQ